MSTGTNRERLEQNNIKLEEIKGKIDKLPEYQDIKPIYASLDVEKVGHFNLTSLNYARVFYKDYIMTTNSSTLYIYKESLLTSINLKNYNPSSFPIHILGETNEYIYIGYIVNADDATLNIYKFNKIDNTINFVKTQTTELISPGGYDWRCGSYSFSGTSMQKAPAVDYNNYLMYNAIALSNNVSRSNWTYFWVAKFNTETESLDVLKFITAGTIGRLIQVAPNYLLSALNDNDEWGQVLYKISIDLSNQVNYVVRKIEYTTTRGDYIQGISYDGKYAFSNGSVYTLKDDLTFNKKVGDNTYNLSMNYNIKAISDKYYLHNNNIYEFDESTMSFTLLLEGVYFINGIICIVKSSGTDRYIITPSQEQIGFIYNGFNYYFEQTEYTNTDKIVSGYEFFNRSHQKVVGTMADNGQLSYTPSAVQQTIPAGYTSGGTVAGDSNLVANNIRLGTTIFGVEGNLEADKPDQTKTVAPTTEEQVITPDTGYELASVTVGAVTSDIDSNIVAENIKKDVSILGVTGTLESGGNSDYNAKLVPTNGRITDYITEISAQLDTSSVTNMGSLFYSCTNLTTIPLLDTSNVTDMNSMFQSCTNLTTIPQLNTSSVTDMNYMFQSCTNLTTIPLLNTSSVTNMSYMFQVCRNLTTIPQLNTSSVTNMQGMFQNCIKLTTIPQLNTSSVTNMSYMFQSCIKLTEIPLLDTSNVTDMNYMFSGCENLSDESLNNILTMCINATSYISTKTLKTIGLTSEQATKCTTLSNYQAFLNAGWTTGY